MDRSRRRKRTRMILNEDNVEENLARSCNFIKVCLILRIRELILKFVTKHFKDGSKLRKTKYLIYQKMNHKNPQ